MTASAPLTPGPPRPDSTAAGSPPPAPAQPGPPPPAPAQPGAPPPGPTVPGATAAAPRPGTPPPGPPLPWPRPVRPQLPTRQAYRLQRLLAPNGFYLRLARWIEASRVRYRLFTAAERTVKREIFGCRMCGQCTLPVTGYACPMSCPKQLRNGPCGGVGADGSCEVHPAVRCVWLVAWERAARQGRVADLQLLQRPADHREWGRSSWVNYWQHRDEGLWVPSGGADAAPPAVWRGPPPPPAGPR